MNALIVTFDDWQALYINGKKVDEGHRLQLRDVFAFLNVDCAIKSASEQWDTEVSYSGVVPDHIDEFPAGALA